MWSDNLEGKDQKVCLVLDNCSACYSAIVVPARATLNFYLFHHRPGLQRTIRLEGALMEKPPAKLQKLSTSSVSNCFVQSVFEAEEKWCHKRNNSEQLSTSSVSLLLVSVLLLHRLAWATMPLWVASWQNFLEPFWMALNWMITGGLADAEIAVDLTVMRRCRRGLGTTRTHAFCHYAQSSWCTIALLSDHWKLRAQLFRLKSIDASENTVLSDKMAKKKQNAILDNFAL